MWGRCMLSMLHFVTFDFRGGPQPLLWPQAAQPQPPGCTETSWAEWRGLGRLPRIHPGFDDFSYETEEYMHCVACIDRLT